MQQTKKKGGWTHTHTVEFEHIPRKEDRIETFSERGGDGKKDACEKVLETENKEEDEKRHPPTHHTQK
jgi:hypothetical protein